MINEPSQVSIPTEFYTQWVADSSDIVLNEYNWAKSLFMGNCQKEM